MLENKKRLLEETAAKMLLLQQETSEIEKQLGETRKGKCDDMTERTLFTLVTLQKIVLKQGFKPR